MLKNTLPGIGSVVEVELIFVAVVVSLVEVVDVVDVVTVVELDVEFESEIEMISSVVICFCRKERCYICQQARCHQNSSVEFDFIFSGPPKL